MIAECAFFSSPLRSPIGLFSVVLLTDKFIVLSYILYYLFVTGYQARFCNRC